MKLVFVNIMHNLYSLETASHISQPPVPLAVLHAVTPPAIETALLDEQTDEIRFDGDVFGFTVTTQFARPIYGYADALRASGKKVILGGIHVTLRPEEAMRHADTIVTGEAESVWPTVCQDLLAGRLRGRYAGWPTPSERMAPIDYRFFGRRRYLQPACVFATRGCLYRCSFCVSSRYHGPFRTKPLDVFERELDQLKELYPEAFLQFTDDCLLGDRGYASELLALVRRKKRTSAVMVTLDQLCDAPLMQELANSGCLGVAVGIESIDDDNCMSVRKHQNVGRALPEAVRRANEMGMHVAALLIVGLPHDTPQRIERTRRYLRELPFALFDLRILRHYPGSPLYDEMLSRGDVSEDWWLKEDDLATNKFLPGHLRVHFRHAHFSPMQLQQATLTAMRDLNRMTPDAISNTQRVGHRANAPEFAAMGLFVRARFEKHARTWLAQVEQAMADSRAKP